MDNSVPQLFVSAGEASGDERAAEVISSLRRIVPDLRVFGMGGEALRAAGAEIIVDVEETAVFGLLEAVVAIAKFRRISRKLESAWLRRRPDLALLVDFGGFNLRFARTLKRHGARVAYFVSPQVWASRPGRIRWVRRYVDLMMVLFKFEESLYARHGIKAVHVGHPLVGRAQPAPDQSEIRRSLGFDTGERLIGLMPGSRDSELRRLLPPLLGASDALRSGGYGGQLVIAAPNKRARIEAMLDGRPLPVVEEDRHSAMAACDLLILASGTAALESALMGVPAIVVYKTSWVTYLAARLLMRVPFVSLPNIILGEEVFPELLQRECEADRIVSEALKILEDAERYDRIRSRISEVTSSLGAPGASDRAAWHLAEMLNRP